MDDESSSFTLCSSSRACAVIPVNDSKFRQRFKAPECSRGYKRSAGTFFSVYFHHFKFTAQVKQLT
jgi:transposase-like protein